MTHFLRISLQVMKNTFLWQWTRMNLRNVHQRQNFMEAKLCCMYDGITIVLLILSFLNCNQTLNAVLYSQQLQWVHENLQRKCPTLVNKGNMLLHNITKPHSARITQERILDLCQSVLPNLPYSPDFAISDFHLFHSIQYALND